MTGVDKADHCTADIAPECFGPGRQKERIVPAPYRQETRLVSPEVFLKSRVAGDVAPVVAEQIQLQLIDARARQIEVVEREPVGRDERGVRDTVGVLPDRRFRLEEGAQRLAVGGGGSFCGSHFAHLFSMSLLPLSTAWMAVIRRRSSHIAWHRKGGHQLRDVSTASGCR